MDGTAPAPLGPLTTPEGQALLAALPPYEESQVLAVTARLRAEGHPPELVSAALTQARLRALARPRLGPGAARLLLTQDGLEQATRPVVARRRAERFVAAGTTHVWDLGCGLGLDAMALAEAGLEVTAVERDPVVAAAARANLSPWPAVRVVEGDLTDVSPGATDGAFLDPARRTPGVADVRGRTRRVLDLEDLSPSWAHVRAVAARDAVTAAKMSPGFPRAEVPPEAEAEWVSVDGSVVECTLWWGAQVDRPGRWAAVGRTEGSEATWSLVGTPEHDPPAPLTEEAALHTWLAEPDRAVVAAGRADALAALTGGAELDPGVGYVTAPEVVDLPWARWWSVVEVLPLHARTVRGWLREHGTQRVTIKKRGVPTDPDAFRRELRLRPGKGGTEETTLVLTRVAGTPRALVVAPHPSPQATLGGS